MRTIDFFDLSSSISYPFRPLSLTSLVSLLSLSIVLCACSSDNSPNHSFTWQQFYSRDQGVPTERLLLYRAKVPSHWIRKDPQPHESISDSTRPNCEFFIDSVYITLHTFPSDTLEQRIPPEAQIERWKRQFDEIDPTSLIVEPRALGGFAGFSFYANGILKGNEHSILAFSMQLAPVHWRTLQSHNQRQMASDYTLKAIGFPDEIAKYKDEIILFANSFELIEEIPLR